MSRFVEALGICFIVNIIDGFSPIVGVWRSIFAAICGLLLLIGLTLDIVTINKGLEKKQGGFI